MRWALILLPAPHHLAPWALGAAAVAVLVLLALRARRPRSRRKYPPHTRATSRLRHP